MGVLGIGEKLVNVKMPFAMRAAMLDISLQFVEQGSRVKRLLLNENYGLFLDF